MIYKTVACFVVSKKLVVQGVRNTFPSGNAALQDGCQDHPTETQPHTAQNEPDPFIAEVMEQLQGPTTQRHRAQDNSQLKGMYSWQDPQIYLKDVLYATYVIMQCKR